MQCDECMNYMEESDKYFCLFCEESFCTQDCKDEHMERVHFNGEE